MNETQPDDFFVKGIEAVQNKELDKALGLFDKAIVNNQNLAASWAFHGDILIKLKKTQDALDSYQNGLNLFPDNVNLLFRYGLLLKKIKKYPDAIPLLGKAVSLAPHNFTLWMTQGDTYFEIHDYSKALASYEKAITINSGNPAAWEKQGWTLRKLGRIDEASKSFKREAALKGLIEINEENEKLEAQEIELRIFRKIRLPSKIERERKKIEQERKKIEQERQKIEQERKKLELEQKKNTFICIHCGKKFIRQPGAPKKFCSMECALSYKSKGSCQEILKKHHEDLLSDPERLDTNFLSDLVGCECNRKFESEVKKIREKKEGKDFEIDYSIVE